MNNWPTKPRTSSKDTKKEETPDPETTEGCFAEARHPDDSIDIFPDPIYPIYSDEEVRCRVAIQGPEFFDPIEYYEVTDDS